MRCEAKHKVFKRYARMDGQWYQLRMIIAKRHQRNQALRTLRRPFPDVFSTSDVYVTDLYCTSDEIEIDEGVFEEYDETPPTTNDDDIELHEYEWVACDESSPSS